MLGIGFLKAHIGSRIQFWCEASTRLKVNLDKNELIHVGEVPRVEELASLLGGKMGKLPSIYLGLSLGGHFKPHLYVMWLRRVFIKR